MKTSLRILTLATFALLLARCALMDPEPEETKPPRPLTAAEKQLAHSDNQFGLTLFRTISDDAPDENVFISPLSVSMALGMTLNGAEGETRHAMEKTLELAGLSQEDINQSYQSLIELLTTLDPDVTLNLANSIWYREGFDVRPEFIDVNQQYFDAEVRALDFGSPDAVDTINGWVDENTNGKIEKILDGTSATGDGLCISRVKHKTFVEVNEEGTEAAAVTVVGMQLTSTGGGPTPVHVNRPFAFAIRERHSGTILFIGKVNTL